jgi:hypothetical protein
MTSNERCIQPLAMSESLPLNCLIHGEFQARIFTVKISETENVDIRKLEEKAPHLNYVAASNLILWMVDLHLDEFGAEPLHVNLDRVDTGPIESYHHITRNCHPFFLKAEVPWIKNISL